MCGRCRSPRGSGCENASSDRRAKENRQVKAHGHLSALRFRADDPAFVNAGDDVTPRGRILFLSFGGHLASDGALVTVYVIGWGMVVAVGRWTDLTGAYPLPSSSVFQEFCPEGRHGSSSDVTVGWCPRRGADGRSGPPPGHLPSLGEGWILVCPSLQCSTERTRPAPWAFGPGTGR